MSIALRADAAPGDVLPGAALVGAALPSRWLGRIEYGRALALQETIVREHRRFGDLLLLLEHDPVYTTGRGGKHENLGLLADAALGERARVLRIGRGGDVTYHGPGQLVGYALIDLRARGGDVHRFLRDLESGVIATLEALGVSARRWPGRTGVWVADGDLDARAMDDEHMQQGRVRKIASIGIGVRGGIALHGFALNVALDLAPFAAIVPCGIAGVRMTTVALETGRTTLDVATVAELAAAHVGQALARGAGAAAGERR